MTDMNKKKNNNNTDKKNNQNTNNINSYLYMQSMHTMMRMMTKTVRQAAVTGRWLYKTSQLFHYYFCY